MPAREEILKRIEKKQWEIRELEAQIRDANTYVQTMQEALRLLPKEGSTDSSKAAKTLRANSALAKTREAILKAGQPLHISDILKTLGKPADKKNRSSLSGTIGAYVREGKIFTRPQPNTFGLIELKDAGKEEAKTDEEDEDVQLSLNGTN